MTTSTTRTLTAGRIVALALVGLAIVGLSYLRLAPDTARVSVPDGARAGQLTTTPCQYDTERGGYAADCGTLVVPENRNDRGSRLIALPVTRIHAQSAHPGAPIFRLEGGPGLTNMTFPMASRYAERHDVVLVGYRGVDSSTPLDCPEVESALKHQSDLLSQASFDAYRDAFRDCAKRLHDDGVDLAGYSIPERVDDLEAARVALGYDRVDLLSESAGTRTAMVYAWRYPKSVHRSVMIGVNPPGNFLWSAKTTDEQLRRYAAACAKDSSCSGRTGDLLAALRRTNADLPSSWWLLPIKASNVRLASFFGLMETTADAAPINGPLTIGTWLSAAKGDASGMWLQSLMTDLVFPSAFTWGEYAAFGRADTAAARAHFANGAVRPDRSLGDAATAFAWGGGALADAWPAGPDDDAYSRVRPSDVPTLLVGGALDLATPPQNATRQLLPSLRHGHQVVLPGFGHTLSFWSEQPAAGTDLVTTFLETGRVDRSQYHPQTVDFTPAVGQTGIAKILAGTMVGLGALVVLSLVWLPLRVHRRGRFGRKSRVFLRTGYAAVLGLGGWIVGVLLVLTTMQDVPLDDELLAVLSIGLPVGLCLAYGWVDREWSARTKATGLAAAVGGALVGGWLGFNATEGIVALLTTIVGATAGGNLALLALDLAWERQARTRPVATGSGALEARPSAG